MKTKLFLITFVLSLMLMGTVLAEPPFAEEGAGSFSTGYFIEYTPIGVYQTGEDLKVNTHVFNISNGYEIDNATTVCKFSLFNKSGHHIISNVAMDYDTTSEDWEYSIGGGNLTINGEHSYLVDCQDSTNYLGGFVNVEFLTTGLGETTGDIVEGLIWLLFILAVLGNISFLVLTLVKLSTVSETIFGILTSWAFLVLMIIVNFQSGLMTTTFIGTLSGFFITILIWSNGVLPLISLVITMFVKGTQKKKPLSVQELTGRSPFKY